jgi:hypothetical protein
MVTNPSLTKDANRRRDDSLVTDLVTRARNATGRRGTRWWSGTPR